MATKKNIDASGLLYFGKEYYKKLQTKFVEIESGKTLTTNDYTTNEKEKLAGIEASADVNVVEVVKVNGTALTPNSNKEVNITVAQGSANGTLAINGSDVSVKGLGSAAYAATTDFDASGAAAAVLGASTDASSAVTVYGVKKALDASYKERFIVERFMQCDDVGIYYTFKDGVCSVSCVYDRYTTDEQEGLSKVNLGSVYPSRHIDDYFRNMHENAVRMFNEIGIENGVLLLSGFFENGEFYMYDPGFRLQGEAPHLLMKAIHGFDQREMLIRFALTGSQGDFDIRDIDDVRFKGKRAATLWFLLKKGEIKEIRGMENIGNDSRIIANVQRLGVGDVVLDEWIGTERQVLTRLYIVCNNIEELKACITEYENKITVISADEDNMLLKCLNADIIV